MVHVRRHSFLIVVLLLGAVASTAVSCPPPVPENGAVIERRPHGDHGEGVQLIVRRDQDNEHITHEYKTAQVACVLFARWPDCVVKEN